MARYDRLVKRAGRVDDRSYNAARKGKQRKASRLKEKANKLYSKARCGPKRGSRSKTRAGKLVIEAV